MPQMIACDLGDIVSVEFQEDAQTVAQAVEGWLKGLLAELRVVEFPRQPEIVGHSGPRPKPAGLLVLWGRN